MWVVPTFVGIYALLGPRGRTRVAQVLRNFIEGVVDSAAPLARDLGGSLKPIAAAIAEAIGIYGPIIHEDLRAPFTKFAKAAFDANTATLSARGESTPDNSIERAAEAFTTAFEFGLGSHAVAMAFESIFPEKLQTLNGMAPMLATMAGFDEVTKELLRPLYNAAFGKSLEYHYRSLFKPELPSEQNAVQWHARRLLTDAQLREIFKYSGLKEKYEAAFVTSAYRPLSPMIVNRLVDDTGFDESKLRDAARFMGYRDGDIELLIEGAKKQAVKSLRASAVSAAIANYEAGIDDDSDLAEALNGLDIADDAKRFIVIAAQDKRLLKVTEDYRKSWDYAFDAGTITIEEYRLALSSLGYVDPTLSALVAAASAKRTGALAKAEVAEHRAAVRGAQHNAVTAALLSYKNREIDALELTAALVALGLEPEQVAAYVALAIERGQKKLPKK